MTSSGPGTGSGAGDRGRLLHNLPVSNAVLILVLMLVFNCSGKSKWKSLNRAYDIAFVQSLDILPVCRASGSSLALILLLTYCRDRCC